MNTPHIDADDLFRQADPESEYPFQRQLIDVREPEEFSSGHAAGALLIPLGQLSPSGLASAGVSPDQPLYFICHSGYRSLVACQILASQGWPNGVNVTGGMLAWHAAGLPIHFPTNP